MRIRINCVIIATVAVALANAERSRAELVNGIEAVVHDSVVTRDEVEALNEQTVDVLSRQYRDQPQVLQQKLEEMRKDNLDKLMERQLILHDFKTAGYNLPDSVIDELVQERIKARYGDRMKLIKTLEAEGITSEKFREQVKENFIIEALRMKNISQEIIISPHKVEVYYLAHRDEPDFKVEDEVKLRMIVLNKTGGTSSPQTTKLAEEIRSKLKEGAAFAEMAKLYSQGKEKERGGDWGWVEKSVLRKELAEAAFGLRAGEVSGVIETPEACFVMLVEDRRTAHSKPLSEVREQIEKNLLLAEQKRLEKQWIDKLRRKTFVRYF